MKSGGSSSPGTYRAKSVSKPNLLLIVLAVLLTLGPSAARAATSQFGPFHTPPGTKMPRHPHSPFNKLNVPPARPLVAGKDFEEGRILIKFKPTSRVVAGLNGVRAPSDLRVAQALTTAGVSDLQPVFPSTAQPIRQIAGLGGNDAQS